MESFRPELAEAISRRRVEQAVETGAEILVTACPQCERILRQAARSGGILLRVADVLELVADSLSGPDGDLDCGGSNG